MRPPTRRSQTERDAAHSVSGRPEGLRTHGHQAASGTVRRWVRDQRPPHALVISGPAQVGKTTLALDLARGLLCIESEQAARPCGSCAACRRIEHGNHPDLHLVAPEGAGGQIRLAAILALVADLALKPMEGRWRVAIIEQAHRLNPDAQNALLKTLEEPVGAVAIILAADDLSALLPTVLSRAARIRLGPVAHDALANVLADRDLGDASRAAEIARMAGGLPGAAIALAAQPETIIAMDRLARSLLDLSSASRRTRLAAVPGLLSDAVAVDDPSDSGGSRSRATPAERRRSVIRILSTWREVARDLCVVARGGGAQVRHLALLEDLQTLGARIEYRAVVAFLGHLDGHIATIEGYANPELTLDVLVLSWPACGPATGVAA